METEYEKEDCRVYAKIDLDAICTNIKNIKKHIKPQTKIMAVIKADGYGHGAVPIAKALDGLSEHGIPTVAAYGVAMVEEGMQLRREGVTKPILVLGSTLPDYVGIAVKNDISLTVFGRGLAEQLSRKAVKAGRTASIHIKVDTGMGRIGYAGSAADAREIAEIAKLPGIRIDGVFSHMACADETDKTSAQRQLARFLEFLALLEKEGVQVPVKHIANSAGIIDMPETQLDMVRSGISTYGLYPSAEVDCLSLPLIPAMELISQISFVKHVEAGATIGYGSTFVASQPMVVATVPVGYADGYPRALSNKGRVLVAGKSAKIIGRICMDQFMVDVTDIPQAAEGMPVTLIGKDGEAFIPVEEVAGLAGSFHYELICGISKRVPRVYYYGGKPAGIWTEFS